MKWYQWPRIWWHLFMLDHRIYDPETGRGYWC